MFGYETTTHDLARHRLPLANGYEIVLMDTYLDIYPLNQVLEWEITEPIAIIERGYRGDIFDPENILADYEDNPNDYLTYDYIPFVDHVGWTAVLPKDAYDNGNFEKIALSALKTYVDYTRGDICDVYLASNGEPVGIDGMTDEATLECIPEWKIGNFYYDPQKLVDFVTLVTNNRYDLHLPA